jgi:hypothetical protein
MKRFPMVLLALVVAADASAAPVRVHSLLDLTATIRGDALASNWEWPHESNFDAYKLRVFAEATPTANLEVDVQAYYTEAWGFELVGAYVQYTPWPERDLHLAAGKIPWFMGTYGAREYSDKNPLIGTPLMYQYPTGLGWFAAPGNVDELVLVTDGGDPAAGNPRYAGGMPVIWESWWDAGIAVVGSARPFEGAFGVYNGAPGWGTAGEEENSGKTFFARVGVTPNPAVRLGVSGSTGPYLNDFSNLYAPPGKDVNDYDQQLLMADAEFLFGHAELRGEAFRNEWQTPTVGDLRVSGFDAEGKYTLAAGLYAAARYDQLRFSRVAPSSGAPRPWHADVDRIEAGLGYRLSRGVLAKAVWQRSTRKAFAPATADEHDDLGALNLTVSF